MKMQSWIDPLQSIPPRLLLLDCQFRGAFSLPPSSSVSRRPRCLPDVSLSPRSSSRPLAFPTLYFSSLAHETSATLTPQAFAKLTINRRQYGPKKPKKCSGILWRLFEEFIRDERRERERDSSSYKWRIIRFFLRRAKKFRRPVRASAFRRLSRPWRHTTPRTCSRTSPEESSDYAETRGNRKFYRELLCRSLEAPFSSIALPFIGDLDDPPPRYIERGHRKRNTNVKELPVFSRVKESSSIENKFGYSLVALCL